MLPLAVQLRVEPQAVGEVAMAAELVGDDVLFLHGRISGMQCSLL